MNIENLVKGSIISSKDSQGIEYIFFINIIVSFVVFLNRIWYKSFDNVIFNSKF